MINRIREYFNKHDKQGHFLLALILSLWGWQYSAITMATVELVQVDILGIQGRERDTILDLLADAMGIWAGIIIKGMF